jgi:uncharacterized membrane protein (DUF106 family)
MSLLNSLLQELVDGFLSSFRGQPAIVSLAVVALITAIALLLVFKWTSNQARLRDVKRRIHAGFFEIRLFNDDLRAILRAQLDILRHTITYLRLSFVPLLWTIVPLALLVSHLQVEYGYTGLVPGQSAIVTVHLRDDQARAASRPALALAVSDGLHVETEPVWIPSLREMSWRVGAAWEGTHQALVMVPGTKAAVTKRIVVSRADVMPRSLVRHAGGVLDSLRYPGEDPLPRDAPVASIAVTYPEQRVSIAGFELHWTIVFFVLALLFALVLRKPLRVAI